MLTEAELAAALRISARHAQRRAGWNPPDSGAARVRWKACPCPTACGPRLLDQP